MSPFFCFLFVGLVAADPKILQLNKFPSGGEFIVDGIEVRLAEMLPPSLEVLQTGAKLYVASKDDLAALRNITITSGSTSTT